MGMTIDETIIQATLLKDGVGKDTYKYEILTSLIDIAKKYQKIEQIIKKHDNDRMPEDYWYIDKIREVLKDGNGVSEVRM